MSKTPDEIKASNARRDKIIEILESANPTYTLLHYFEQELREHADQRVSEERNKVIQEAIDKGLELCVIIRKADPVTFPTMVIRAEAIEDFVKHALPKLKVSTT